MTLEEQRAKWREKMAKYRAEHPGYDKAQRELRKDYMRKYMRAYRAKHRPEPLPAPVFRLPVIGPGWPTKQQLMAGR